MVDHLSRLWETFGIFCPIFAVLFGISSGFLFLGFIKYDECPFEPLLPQSLLGFGLISLICTIIALILIVVSDFKKNDSGTHFTYVIYAFIVMVVNGVAATIVASVIAYVLYARHTEFHLENPNDQESFCHPLVYNFCYRFSATVLGLTSIFIIGLIFYFSNKR